ncbi:TRAP transporter large permease subunit [Salinicola corii]|uniref:TRAP transporter large permease protein n=1 Tax=Salinicola corii TaxID=2606937 RepID=A0A640WDT4_9GAMM|nr:TRAP transporter large permease subunit [Salinicola corii]KAA0018140.1 TRAP transporter large permease subunit [Salinicola corii]
MTAIMLTAFTLLVALLASGVWVGLGLAGVGIVSLETFRGFMPVEKLLAQTVWNAATSAELVALPLFILMGELLFRSRLTQLLFDGLAPWVDRIPGRLLHTNVLGCTLFAAISGSSAATTATVGRITSNELMRRGYDARIAAGSLAGAGTLGFLIPPSTIMIIYGVLAQVSILKMFIAGIVPGLLLALAFMSYLGVYALSRPGQLPPRQRGLEWQDYLRALTQLGPVALLIAFVIGSMLTGMATPTEAGAVGVLGALIVCVLQRCLNWKSLWSALMGAAQITSMIGLIIVGAMFLSVAMGFLNVPRTIADAIGSLGLSPLALVAMLLVFYVVLGMLLEGMSIIVMTLPITLPLIIQAGFDPIWFGVFLVLVVEMAQITPPVGFNLFVINGITGMKIGQIARAVLPFFLIMVAFTLLLALVPEIVTWLPDHLQTRG